MTANQSVFDYQTNEDILIVTPVRDFRMVRDSDIRDAYNETYRQLTCDSVCHLIFNFSNLSYIDSTFVGIMIRLAKKARDGGGKMVLCHLSDEIRGILKQLMLLETPNIASFWKRAETLEIALEGLQSKQAEE